MTPYFSPQAVEFFKSDEYRAEIEQMANEARKKGVSGVPFPIINGRWAVSGGQTADVYTQVCLGELLASAVG